MLAQIRSELLKLTTVRTTMLFALATAGLTLLVLVLQAVSAGGELLGPLTEPATQLALLGSGGPVTLIAIVFGCLALATEFRHHTIVTTLLSDPNRGRVVIAKAIGALAAGAALAITAVGVAVAGTWVALWMTGTGAVIDPAQLGRVVAGTIGAAAFGSLLGMGIGGIVRNQALAVGATLLALLALEPLVASLAPAVGRWLPSNLGTVLASGQAGAGVSPGAALLILAAYGIATATVATIGLRRADIT
jgi:ABC-2 type transport system permease protein